MGKHHRANAQATPVCYQATQMVQPFEAFDTVFNESAVPEAASHDRPPEGCARQFDKCLPRLLRSVCDGSSSKRKTNGRQRERRKPVTCGGGRVSPPPLRQRAIGLRDILQSGFHAQCDRGGVRRRTRPFGLVKS